MINLDDDILTNKQRKAQMNFILNLRKELKELIYQYNHIDIINTKNDILKKINILLFYLKKSVPYFLVAGATFGGFSINGSAPFIIDEKKVFLESKKEIDSLNNISIVSQYEKYNYPYHITIFYYSPWQQEDNFYVRNQKIYHLNEINDDLINNIFDYLKDDKDIEYLIGKPDFFQNEKNSSIDNIDYENGYIKILIYDKSKDDFIIKQEDIEDNFETTLCYILLTLLLELIPTFVDLKFSKYEYDDILLKLEKKYPIFIKEELAKKLVLKLDNLKLVENNYER